jgi:hypothetical protein
MTEDEQEQLLMDALLYLTEHLQTAIDGARVDTPSRVCLICTLTSKPCPSLALSKEVKDGVVMHTVEAENSLRSVVGNMQTITISWPELVHRVDTDKARADEQLELTKNALREQLELLET